MPPVARRIESPAPARVAPTQAARERETPPQGGAWLNMLLVGVVLTAGLALVAFTLGRPFLPPNWLP
jgi:hypothetical protein